MKFEFSGMQARLWETFLFLIKLLVFSVPLYLILTFQDILRPLQDLVSWNVHLILEFLGFQIVRDGFLLSIHGGNPFVFLVSEDCTGWKSMLFLLALMMAVPKVPRKKRLIGISFGIPLIYLGNLIRILIIVYIQQTYGLGLANIIHDYLWQAGLVSLVLAIWILWLVWVGKIGIFKKYSPIT